MFQNDRHRIQCCEIGSRDISDHSPIYLVLNLESRIKKAIWRLNTSLLNNKTIVQQIKSDIQTFHDINDNGEVNPDILWDALKAVVRGKLISVSAGIKKAKEIQLKQLEKNLIELEREHSKNQKPQLLTKINDIRNQISDMYKEKLEKKYTFLKQAYYEVGPKATKLLAKKLRKKLILQSIYKIENPQTKQVCNNLDEIDEAFQKYYKSLYSQPQLESKKNIKGLSRFTFNWSTSK